MNSNVIEIVTILIQKLLHNEDVIANEEEIIQGLLDLGYDLKEIETAFELIFSSTEIIGMSESFENHNYLPTSERVLSPRERFIFSTEAQEILLKLLYNKLIDLESLENIMQKVHNLPLVEIGTRELWFLIKTSISDQIDLIRIKNRIPNFLEIKDDENLFIH